MLETIFDYSESGRYAKAQVNDNGLSYHLDDSLKRQSPLGLPACSELDVVRHYTRLSRKNFSIDTHFYPLGSCTMKYNPRGVHRFALNQGFSELHPLDDPMMMQGTLTILYRLQTYLSTITGMAAVSLSPMAGSQGELAGCAIIRAYHASRGEERSEMIIPDAAHGTNSASAVMAGFTVKEIKTGADGDIDLTTLGSVLSCKTAGIMLTNPSTLGVFERKIQKIAEMVHGVGGLLYYDGANLNAILSKVTPGSMGFDVIHLNLHKTFATPHGGGGPGAGPIGVSEKLAHFLPGPLVQSLPEDRYVLSMPEKSIGRLSTFFGNTAILLRAYAYILLIGREGLSEVSDMATLNANYLAVRLKKIGYTLAYPLRRASHEFVISLQKEKKRYGISASDLAKRLLDYGFHSPTIYFPQLVPECLLIEPTETESKQSLDKFLEAMAAIRKEMETDPTLLLNAPMNTACRRVDESFAARQMQLSIDCIS